MLPDRVDVHSVETIRAVLDRFDVGGRLRHVREFVWRGGTLELRVEPGRDTQALNVAYTLSAEWAAAVLERPDLAPVNALVAWDKAVVEGRWVRGRTGYDLRVGIDQSVPSALYVRSSGFLSYVPFLGRQTAQVEQGLNLELTTYANAFLSHYQPVPQAVALDAERLDRLGLGA